MLKHGKVGLTRQTLVKLLEDLQKENQCPMWKGLFPRFYPNMCPSDDEEVAVKKKKPEERQIRRKIGILKKYLKQLERSADSGDVQRFKDLRSRFRSERAFASQLIRCGRELLEKRKGKKEGR